MWNVDTRKPSRKKPFCLIRLFVAIFLCAFHLGALARVVDRTHLKLDVKSLNDTIPGDLGLRRDSPSVSPTRFAQTVSLNDDNYRRASTTEEPERKKVTWEDAHRTGEKILAVHQQRLNSGHSGYTGKTGGLLNAKTYFDAFFTSQAEDWNGEPSPFIQPLLKEDGITSKKGDWLFSHIKDCKSEYQHRYTYDKEKQEGVIIVIDIERELSAVLPWSEVVFQEYDMKFKNRVIRNLKYIYQVFILNEDTQDIIQKALDSGDGKETNVGSDKWQVFKPGSESFTALLGCENGRGAGHLVNDHFAEMGRKQVSEIHASMEVKSMKIVLSPVP